MNESTTNADIEIDGLSIRIPPTDYILVLLGPNGVERARGSPDDGQSASRIANTPCWGCACSDEPISDDAGVLGTGRACGLSIGGSRNVTGPRV